MTLLSISARAQLTLQTNKFIYSLSCIWQPRELETANRNSSQHFIVKANSITALHIHEYTVYMYVIYIKIYISTIYCGSFQDGSARLEPSDPAARLKERDELISLTVLSRVSFLVFVLYMKSSDTKML